MRRENDFDNRSRHLANLTDEELEAMFWDLTDQVVTPLLEIAEKHTSPSIERSVILRMGFNSIEAKELVDSCIEHGVLGKGAGHVVWKLSKMKGISIRDAGDELLQGKGWETVKEFFGR